MNVERLTRLDKEQAVDVLASSFYNYPVIRYVLKNSGEKYDKHIKALMGFFCESRYTRNFPILGIRVDSNLVAVSGVNEPYFKPRSPKLIKVYDELRITIGGDAIERLESYEAKSSANVPKGHFYFIGIIGVKPEHQGKGYAKKIIQKVHKMSEENEISTGVCLCTEEPANVSFYKHLGYKIIAEANVENIHTWCMFRENKL